MFLHIKRWNLTSLKPWKIIRCVWGRKVMHMHNQDLKFIFQNWGNSTLKCFPQGGFSSHRSLWVSFHFALVFMSAVWDVHTLRSALSFQLHPHVLASSPHLHLLEANGLLARCRPTAEGTFPWFPPAGDLKAVRFTVSVALPAREDRGGCRSLLEGGSSVTAHLLFRSCFNEWKWSDFLPFTICVLD